MDTFIYICTYTKLYAQFLESLYVQKKICDIYIYIQVIILVYTYKYTYLSLMYLSLRNEYLFQRNRTRFD